MEIKNIDFGGRKILIAEDTETSRYYYEMAFRKCNITVLWARTGVLAVEMFKNAPEIELVLMDLNMPEMDGFEAMRLIKQLNPDIPIIVQSASVVSGEEDRCYEAGGKEFLAKPIPQTVLLEILEKYLK